MSTRKTLFIVESPAKIKTIGKFLGPHVTVMSTLGHIKDLPQKTLGVSMDKKGNIELEYVPLDKKDKVIREICKAAKTADLIILGTDPDREGELIAWHVEGEVAKVVKGKAEIKRIVFNEITKPAIEAAMKHQGDVDRNKVAAQQARRVLDRWVGYEVSPILWKLLRKGLSAGRVQSVALRLICDRDEEIKNFKTEESWSIEALGTIEKTKVPLTLTHIKKKKAALKTGDQAKKVVTKLAETEVKVTDVADTTRSKKPQPPFITSTLQQAASQQLNFKVSRTMELAQKLYEGIPLEDEQTPVALITYMRTDSPRISETALKEVRSFVSQKYGAPYIPPKAHVYGGKKKSQDAHEAIRPVDVKITPEQVSRYLDPALYKLYTLIWKRFVASQMSEAKFAIRKITVEGGDFTLSASGSTLLFDGFRAVHNSPDEEAEASVSLPETITLQAVVPLESITPKQHFTQPPARFSEASLVKELEKEGIGRPSTYATILKTIQARAYTELDDKKRFMPTELGIMVTKLLVSNLPKIMNSSFTAEMEGDLDKIAQGELERDTLLNQFYDTFSQDLVKFRGQVRTKQFEQTELLCPECKKHKLVIRFGKSGPFVGCPGYPECSFTSNFQRLDDGRIELSHTPEPVLLDERCPKCSKQLRRVIGKFGPFVACSGYPECKYIKETFAAFPCPNCGKQLMKRNWKGKIFWGCKGYPGCSFSISGDICETACPQCASPYLRVKQGGPENTLICPTKECGFSRAMTAQDTIS